MEPLIRENLVIRKYLNEESAKILESRTSGKTMAEVEEEIKDQIYQEAYGNVDVEKLENIIKNLGD